MRPRLVVPIHWDTFVLPLADRLELLDQDALPAGFDVLRERLVANGIRFDLMRGAQTVTPFAA